MNKICIILFFSVSLSINCQNNLINEIKEKGYITVALLKNDNPPYYYINSDGELSGSDIQLITSLSHDLGVEVRYNREADTYVKLLELIENKTSDITISRLARESGYSQKILFSNPYLKVTKGLLINRIELYRSMEKAQSVKSYIKKFKGSIGILGNSSDIENIKSLFPMADIVKYKKMDRGIKELLKGEVLALFDDSTNFDRVINSYPEYLLKLQKITFSDLYDNLVIAVHKDEILLKQWIDIVIDELTRNSEVSNL